MSTANHRENRFELDRLFQGPNGVGVVMVERGVAGSRPPPRELSDDELEQLGGPGSLAKVIEAWDILERAYAKKHEAAEAALAASDPNEVHRALHEVIATERRNHIAQLEEQRLELEAIAKRAELEQLDAELEAKRKAAAAAAPAPKGAKK